MNLPLDTAANFQVYTLGDLKLFLTTKTILFKDGTSSDVIDLDPDELLLPATQKNVQDVEYRFLSFNKNDEREEHIFKDSGWPAKLVSGDNEITSFKRASYISDCEPITLKCVGCGENIVDIDEHMQVEVSPPKFRLVIVDCSTCQQSFKLRMKSVLNNISYSVFKVQVTKYRSEYALEHYRKTASFAVYNKLIHEEKFNEEFCGFLSFLENKLLPQLKNLVTEVSTPETSRLAMVGSLIEMHNIVDAPVILLEDILGIHAQDEAIFKSSLKLDDLSWPLVVKNISNVVRHFYDWDLDSFDPSESRSKEVLELIGRQLTGETLTLQEEALKSTILNDLNQFYGLKANHLTNMATVSMFLGMDSKWNFLGRSEIETLYQAVHEDFAAQYTKWFQNFLGICFKKSGHSDAQFKTALTRLPWLTGGF